MMNRRTKSTKQGWTKTDRYTYAHESGVKLVRDVNRNLWVVEGACEWSGYGWPTLWIAMSFAAETPANYV